MAKRKQATAEAMAVTPTLDAPQLPEIVTPQPEAPQPAAGQPAETPAGPLLPDPFTFKTVNLGGYKVHLQHSRQAREIQIRFGDGAKNDMPSDAVRDFIKTHKTRVTTNEGEPKDVQLFHWNDNDRAWGTRIPHDPSATPNENDEAREKVRDIAKPIFDEVAKLVAAERKAALEASR